MTDATQPNASSPNSGPACNTSSCVDREQHKRNLRNAQQALVNEFHTLVGDAERLLKHTSDSASAGSEELRQTLSANLERAKALLKDSEATLREQSRAAVQATEEYVHEHPLQSVGIAAGVGFLLGLLVCRR